MTYREANRTVRRTGFFLLVFAGVALWELSHIVLATVNGRGVSSAAWWVFVLSVLGVAALWFSMRRHIRVCAEIKTAWENDIENISLFLFLVSDHLKRSEIHVIRHLWKSDSARRTSMVWSTYQIEQAASTYKEGQVAFLFGLLALLGRGCLEFSPKSFHRLAIAQELLEVAKKKYSLDGFAIHDEENTELARRALESLSGPQDA